MAFELLLLVALIIIFVVTFCGLLQKIRKTYERDRRQAERELANNRTNRTNNDATLSEVYVNPTFFPEANRTSENSLGSDGVFPSAPPPYTETYCDSPPKYEDIVKDQVTVTATS